MEFARHSSTPFIADAVSEQDWSRQHVTEHIQSMQNMAGSRKDSGVLLPLRRRSLVSLKRRGGSNPKHCPETGPAGVTKRRRFDTSNRVLIKSNTHGNTTYSPAIKIRPAGDWEQMLRLSLDSLQGLYAEMNTSAPATGRLLGDKFPLHLADRDPCLVASRAMHHAAGSCGEEVDQDRDRDQDACSPGSASTGDWADERDSCSDDQPTTPGTAQMHDDSDIDGEVSMDMRRARARE